MNMFMAILTCAGVAHALAQGEYIVAGWATVAAIMVLVNSVNARNARRYSYIRKTTTAVHNPETKKITSVTPPELDEAIDRMINK